VVSECLEKNEGKMKQAEEDRMSNAQSSSAVTRGTYAFPLTYAQLELWVLNELDSPGKSLVTISERS